MTALFSSCGKPCIEPRGIEGAGLTITFFNTANNEYFYPENTNLSPYKIDSLRVKDSKGKLLRTPYQLNSDPRNPLFGIYVVGIYPIFIPTDDEAAYNSEQTKFIYIKYNYNTFDTLKLVYKAKKEKCANMYVVEEGEHEFYIDPQFFLHNEYFNIQSISVVRQRQ